MDFKEKVLQIIAEVCEDNVVKEEHDLDIFDAGLIDSFATVELLVQIGEQLDINVPITEFDKHSEFYIEDNVYEKKEQYIKSMEGKNEGLSYAESLEYDDFQIMLDILKGSDAEPLFVIIPVNGEYYDYTGFSEKGRQDYYTRIKKQISDSGFTYADYSDHEYDPYFMRDTIHIGWKGWVYLNEDMENFLK